MAINYIVVRKRSRKAVKRIKGGITIVAPGGPYYVGEEYEFTATTTEMTPTWSWSVGPGATIVSGGLTDTVFIRFDSATTVTITATVAGVGSAKKQITATGAAYSPSLDFSDDRNSMYAGILN